jgi:PKD repeat protein
MNETKYIQQIDKTNEMKFSFIKYFIIHISCFLFCITLFSGCYKEKVFPVKADFSIEVIDNNYSVPVRIKITNNTTGAETYNWTFTGANADNSTAKDPGTVQYDLEGTYTLRLDAANPNGGMDSKEITVNLDPPIRIGFTVTNTQSWYPDVTVLINDTTKGATTYQWTFEGGIPASSTQQQPGNVVFSAPGEHKISLTVGNGRINASTDTTITVLPALVNDFKITWDAIDDDMEVPFTAFMQNSSVSATRYNWSFTGGTPASSTDSLPAPVTYNTAGTYTITLTASNDKKSVPLSKTITLLPNSNLLKFYDVKLGINTAQNTIGSYFSSVLGKVLKSSEITADNGSLVDFAYFGLNNTFGYNLFASPNAVQNYAFAPIPGAIDVQIINSQETCGCASSMTSAQFDAMTNDVLFQTLNITQTTGGFTQFDNTLVPRVILFKTQDGRKGAVKIKQYIDAGQQSYIVCDVKITKQ